MLTRALALLALVAGLTASPAAAQETPEPLTYAERGTLARSQAWVDRVQMATTAAALQALTADPQSEGYTQGIALARYYLQQQEYVSVRVAWMVLVSDTVTSDISDQALTALIVSQWPSFAVVLVP